MAQLDHAAAAPALALPRPLSRVLSRPATAYVAAIGLAALNGLFSGALFPRGPVTGDEALLVMALALGVGVFGGRLVPSRWMIAALLVAHFAAFELVRLDAVGPTVDAPRLDSTYGVLALVLSRGVHGLLVLLPLGLGVVGGAAAAQRMWEPKPRRRHRLPLGTIALSVAVLGLAFVIAEPASTPPILGADGKPVPGSIAELSTIELGGSEHALLVRAADPDRPVLLYLAGGPGQSDMAVARSQVVGWEQDFVFATYDQRGNGKSYGAIEPVTAFTLDRAVADVIEVTEHLRTRFGEQKVYLIGESWGSILGVLAVDRRPDLYHAWIGSGQMVNVVETDRQIYFDLVAHAEKARDTAMLATLDAMGEPPYRDIPWANANVFNWYDHLYKPYMPSAGFIERAEASGLDFFGLLGSEYDLIEKTNVVRGLLDTFSLMYPQLYALDLRERVPSLDVPVYILDGAAELEGRRNLALDWFERLDAPAKQLFTFDNAAHAVAFEQGDDVQRLLNEVIVPATYGR